MKPQLHRGDWIRVTWMEGNPAAEVIDFDDYGNPVVEHPLLPGLGPIILEDYGWEFSSSHDDPCHFLGAYI